MYKLSVIIDGIPKSYNKVIRSHYHKVHKEKQYWHRVVFYAVASNRPKSPLKKCKIKIVRRYYRMLDYDGLVASMKPLVDGLIHAGIIKDDSYKITGPWDVTQEFLPKKQGGHVEIEVIEKENQGTD